MSYQVLARKWRPRNFSELVGQEHVVSAISNALDNNRLHHAYLFTGTRGVGKTTIARIFSKSLNCEQGMSSTPCGQCATCLEIESGNFVDLLEIDAASRTKVEDTRELLDNVQYKPTRGEYKVYLIDEVHMLSKHSFNALLKTLEEPPPHVKFLLATTDPQKLPITILSRCLQFNLKALSRSQISEQLANILGQEHISFEDAAIAQLARAAQGSMRDALSLTDQAIAQGNGLVSSQIVADMLGLMDKDQVLKLVHGVLNKDASEVMAQVEALSFQAPDYVQVIAEILSLLHQVALTQFVPDACKLETVSARAIYQLSKMVSPEHVQLLYQIALQGKKDLPYASDGRAGLEMTLLRMLAFSPAGLSVSADELQTLADENKETRSEPSHQPEQFTAPVVEPAGEQVVEVDSQHIPAETENLPQQSEHSDAADNADIAIVPEANEQSAVNTLPEEQGSDFDHQMMANLEHQQQQIMQQAESFHPTQYAPVEQEPSVSSPELNQTSQNPQPEINTQTEESPQSDEADVTSSAPSLSATESLLALKQKVAQSVATGAEQQKESDSSVKKPQADSQDVQPPFPGGQGSSVEPVSPDESDTAVSDNDIQGYEPSDSSSTFSEPDAQSPVEQPQGDPLPINNGNGEVEGQSAPAFSQEQVVEPDAHDTPPFPVDENPEPKQTDNQPGSSVSVAAEKSFKPAVSTPTPATQPVQQNPLQPPWPVDPSITVHVPASSAGRAGMPDGSGFIEPAQEFDPNAHLEEEVEVEVDFDVPAFLDNGEKVIAATQLDTWSSLIEQMQITALTKQLALHSAYQKTDDKVVLTLLQEKEHLISDTAVSQLTNALSEVLQQQVTLEIVLEQPINTPFAVQQTINRVRMEHAHHVVETNEAMVNLKNTFAAQVVEGSVKAR